MLKHISNTPQSLLGTGEAHFRPHTPGTLFPCDVTLDVDSSLGPGSCDWFDLDQLISGERSCSPFVGLMDMPQVTEATDLVRPYSGVAPAGFRPIKQPVIQSTSSLKRRAVTPPTQLRAKRPRIDQRRQLRYPAAAASAPRYSDDDLGSVEDDDLPPLPMLPLDLKYQPHSLDELDHDHDDAGVGIGCPASPAHSVTSISSVTSATSSCVRTPTRGSPLLVSAPRRAVSPTTVVMAHVSQPQLAHTASVSAACPSAPVRARQVNFGLGTAGPLVARTVTTHAFGHMGARISPVQATVAPAFLAHRVVATTMPVTVATLS